MTSSTLTIINEVSETKRYYKIKDPPAPPKPTTYPPSSDWTAIEPTPSQEGRSINITSYTRSSTANHSNTNYVTFTFDVIQTLTELKFTLDYAAIPYSSTNQYYRQKSERVALFRTNRSPEFNPLDTAIYGSKHANIGFIPKIPYSDRAAGSDTFIFTTDTDGNAIEPGTYRIYCWRYLDNGYVNERSGTITIADGVIRGMTAGTEQIYATDLTLYTDGSFSYSDPYIPQYNTKSDSAYRLAEQAYNVANLSIDKLSELASDVNDTLTRYHEFAVPVSSWVGSGPWTFLIDIANLEVKENTIFNINPSPDLVLQAQNDGFGLVIGNRFDETSETQIVTLYAVGVKPTSELQIQVTMEDILMGGSNDEESEVG